MHRVLRVLVSSGIVLAAGCGDSSRISAELQNDLALASAGADLELASRSTAETRVVGAVERTTPPSRAVAPSARAPRPRRSPTPQVTADVQDEIEIMQEPEVASLEEPVPAPAPVEETPVEIAASSRPRAAEPVFSGGSGPSTRGPDWGTIIGIAGAVVIRGGGVGEDRCIPPGAGRGRMPIAINERFPPRGRGMEQVVMGGRTGGRQVVHTAPAMPRDMPISRPISSPSSIRPMQSGGGSSTGGRVGGGRPAATTDVQ